MISRIEAGLPPLPRQAYDLGLWTETTELTEADVKHTRLASFTKCSDTEVMDVLGWLRLFARSRVERTLLLAPDEFDALLMRERSRADRATVFPI